MIIGIFGKPRAGKSTLLAYYARYYLRRKRVVYSTEYIDGTIHISPDDFGLFEPVEGSVILIDEIGTIFNSRDYKRFPTAVRDFVALAGHYKVTVIWVSQTVDVDKAIRNRTHSLYQVRKGLFGFSHVDAIYYDLTVDDTTHDLVEGYYVQKGFLRFIGYIIGQNRLLYRPRYYKYFDSYNKPLTFTKETPDEVYKINV